MKKIQMVDLHQQYEAIKNDIDSAIQRVIDTSSFINGEDVRLFSSELARKIKVKHVIPCANGTDALTLSLLALNLPQKSKVICPAFNYVATAETVALAGLTPVYIDVDKNTFNLDINQLEQTIDENTSAIMPVHLFGQCAEMDSIMSIAKKYSLAVIEDTAQAIGAYYSSNYNGFAGTIGNVGTTSFFPSKNLGCYGDGGAVFTNDDDLATKIKMIANHGQIEKYQFEIVGMNSRLDTLQAAILRKKLTHLDAYISKRQELAHFYSENLSSINELQIPQISANSTHVFHQYTLQIRTDLRNDFISYLNSFEIPTMIYYPKPLHLHNAYKYLGYKKGDFPVSENLCEKVVSLPMHTEMDNEQKNYIINTIKNFFNER